jgi:hypothetical protein
VVIADPASEDAAAFVEIAKNLAAQISIRVMREAEQPLPRITF